MRTSSFIFFVAIKKKKTKKNRWELVSWRHVSKGSSSSSSVKPCWKWEIIHSVTLQGLPQNWPGFSIENKMHIQRDNLENIYKKKRPRNHHPFHPTAFTRQSTMKNRGCEPTGVSCPSSPSTQRRHNHVGGGGGGGRWRHNGMDRIICLWAAIIKQ